MTKEQLAELLNGREYGKEITKVEAAQAKAAGLIVVYGASDDLMDFNGACYDEVGAYEGGTAVLYKTNQGVEVVADDIEIIREIEDDFKLWVALGTYLDRKNLVEAVWAPSEPEASWLITTNLPHATFDVMEDDELYCRGVVISVADLT